MGAKKEGFELDHSAWPEHIRKNIVSGDEWLEGDTIGPEARSLAVRALERGWDAEECIRAGVSPKAFLSAFVGRQKAYLEAAEWEIDKQDTDLGLALRHVGKSLDQAGLIVAAALVLTSVGLVPQSKGEVKTELERGQDLRRAVDGLGPEAVADFYRQLSDEDKRAYGVAGF